MKTRLALAALCILTAVFVSADSSVVVLRGGKRLDLAKPYVQRGSQAILTLRDGTVMSVPVSEIDRAATQEARSRSTASSALPPPPQTPVEAAKAQRSAAPAKVRLGDSDVSHPLGDFSAGPASSDGGGEAKVDVSEWEQTVTPDGLVVKGSVRNTGKGQAENISLSISAKNEAGKSIATASASLASGALEEGAAATFTATLPLKARAASLQFRPSWSTAVTTVKREVPGSPKGDAEKGENRPAVAAPPPPPPPPEERPAYKPSPDYAPPPANAPTSAPEDNRLGYLPGAHEETPPPPPPPPPPSR
jgi:hypothetical protein